MSDTIPYTLRVSPRARRVRLRIQPGRGLLITVPQGLAKSALAAVLEEKRAWIEQTLAEVDARTPAIYREWPPRTLELAALGQSVSIRWLDSDDGAAEADGAGASVGCWRWVDAATLELKVANSGRELTATLIAAALKMRAREYLGPRLERLSRASGLEYQRMVVRGQRSRWGSCSSRGTISLNYKLLFLAPDLVDYVILHELAHTRHMNHSPAYWAQLEAVCPGSRELDAALSRAGRQVPPWLELAG